MKIRPHAINRRIYDAFYAWRQWYFEQQILEGGETDYGLPMNLSFSGKCEVLESVAKTTVKYLGSLKHVEDPSIGFDIGEFWFLYKIPVHKPDPAWLRMRYDSLGSIIAGKEIMALRTPETRTICVRAQIVDVNAWFRLIEQRTNRRIS